MEKRGTLLIELLGIKRSIDVLTLIKKDYEEKATPRRPLRTIIQALAIAIECVTKHIPQNSIVDLGVVKCPSCKSTIISSREMPINIEECYCWKCSQKIKL